VRHDVLGNLIYDRLKRTGHDVFAVNPNMQRFEGDRCYPDVKAIPGGVDGVVIITRPEITGRSYGIAARPASVECGCTDLSRRARASRRRRWSTAGNTASA
jgi:hypothetical protein